MTPADTVRAALAKLTPIPWAVEFYDQGCQITANEGVVGVLIADVADASGIVTIINTLPALLAELAVLQEKAWKYDQLSK